MLLNMNYVMFSIDNVRLRYIYVEFLHLNMNLFSLNIIKYALNIESTRLSYKSMKISRQKPLDETQIVQIDVYD